MKTAKLIYRASVDGDVTVEQQIINAEVDSLTSGLYNRDENFEISLKYEITRTITNIFSNASIFYGGRTTPFCESLNKKLIDIFFQLHDFGHCFLILDENMRILEINQKEGNIEIIDKSYQITKCTQKQAAKKALSIYGVVTNAAYSVIDERGVIGMFSPQKDTVVKASQTSKLEKAFKYLFGVKKNQRKFMITEVPMTYSGITLPVADLKLLENKKDAVATVARIYGIGEDMIQGGSTFENKKESIVQTYSDYKGLIYNWISQIESQMISFRNIENYEVKFSGVPQLEEKTNNI